MKVGRINGATEKSVRVGVLQEEGNGSALAGGGRGADCGICI